MPEMLSEPEARANVTVTPTPSTEGQQSNARSSSGTQPAHTGMTNVLGHVVVMQMTVQ